MLNITSRYIFQAVPNEDLYNFGGSLSVPHLSLSDSGYLETPITLSEVNSAIDALKLNKVPGADGFLAEYYKEI